MVNPFEIIAQRLIDLGFYDFLFPFIITSAIFYGLLKKTKVLGESVTLNGALALSIAFLIFGFPRLFLGVSLASPFSRFFTQATVWILIFGVGILLASFFYPDITKFLVEQFTRRTVLMVMIVIGISLLITSGFISVFTGVWGGEGGLGGGVSSDIIIIATALIIFIILIIIAGAIARV